MGSRMIEQLVSRGLCVFLVAVLVHPVLAAPGVLVTEPPVTPPDAGPPTDPAPAAGQWFKDRFLDEYESRGWEFHDNVVGFGGGAASSFAIEGHVTSIAYSGTDIVAFLIDATITNDLPSSTGVAMAGTNSHDETVMFFSECVCDMLDVKLTAEFAIDADAFTAWGGPMDPPYTDTDPHIVAEDHDQLGWYSFPDTGEYLVPTWDFGDIPVATSVTLPMSFTVDGGGLPEADPRYGVLEASLDGELDIFLNRSTSLKVSDWIESGPVIDTGLPYPEPPDHSSDVSVFFLPEPATLAVLLAGGLLVLAKRSR